MQKNFTMKAFSIVYAFIILIFIGSINLLYANEKNEVSITWYPFKWIAAEDYGNLKNPRGLISIDATIEGIGGFKGFQISLDIQHSYIYQSGMDVLLWRNPGLNNKMRSLQAAGHTKTMMLERAEIGVRNSIMGYADLMVIDRRGEPEDAEVSGFLGYEFFASTNKILLIDQPGSRYAITDEIPESWESKAHFTRMESSPNHLTIQITANNRRVNLNLDPSPKPALILYRKRDFKRIASEQYASDSLIYYPPKIRKDMKLGGKKLSGDISFGPYRLKNHDVYLMSERNQRRGTGHGLITQTFFEDYVLIIDFKNKRFGIIPPAFIN